MPTRSADFEDLPEDESPWDEDEGECDNSEDRADSTVPCPYCQKEILEDSLRCPHCERYISEEDQPPQRKPWLIILGVALSMYVVYRWIAG